MGFEDFPKKTEVRSKGDQSVGQPQGGLSEEELLAKRVAMANMAGAAVESSRRSMYGDRISGMADNLKSVNGNDWAEFRSLVKTLDITEEEAQAAEETIVILQSMRPEFSEERRRATLDSLAKRSKIIEVAIAKKVFDRLPHQKWAIEDNKTSIRSAATRLLDALSYISSETDVKEGLEQGGMTMGKDEEQEIIERGKRLNIV